MTDALSGLRPAERHRVVAAGFTEHVVAAVDWDVPTPVSGWRARDIVDHLVSWSREFLAAADRALGGDPPGPEDPEAAWVTHCADIQAMLDGPGSTALLTHPYVGTHQLAETIDQFYTADVFMHTWDLATSLHRDPGLDPGFAEELLAGMSGMEDVLRSSGQYGPPVAVAAGADPVTRLAGFIGRDPQWRN